MPPFGDVNLTIEDGALGAVTPSNDNTHVAIGASSLGPVAAMLITTSLKVLTATYGYGPMVESAAFSIFNTGAPAIAMRTSPTNLGTASAVTRVGSGTSVITLTLDGTVGAFDDYQGRVEFLTAGTIGVTGITFRVSLDKGRTWNPTASLGTASTYTIPNTGVTLAFAAGTILTTDIATFTTSATHWAIADVSACFATLSASTQEWSFAHVVGAATAGDHTTIDSAMTNMATQYRYAFALTETRDITPSQTLAVTDATETSPIVITVASTTGLVSGMTATVTGVTGQTGANGTFAILVTSGTEITLVGSTTVGAYVSGGSATIVETEAEWAASLETSFAGFSSTRVAVGAGHALVSSPISSRLYRRPASWTAAARCVSASVHVDLARVADEKLVGTSFPDPTVFPLDTDVYHDERVSPGLDAARFLTLRTHIGKGRGVFIKNPNIMAPSGSDFTLIQYRRVMDLACRTTRNFFLQELSNDVRLDKTTGFILEKDASTLEKTGTSTLRAVLVDAGHASSARCVVSRIDNLSSTKTLHTTVRVIPLGYLKDIEVDIAFENPAIAA